MAKRRARGAPHELTRADLKALEARAVATAPSPVVEQPGEAVPEPVSPRRGVLPPRGSRVVTGVPALTRAQEMAFIRSDLRRLTILAALMVAILIALAVVLR